MKSLLAGLLALTLTILKLPLLGAAWLLVSLSECLERAQCWASGRAPEADMDEILETAEFKYACPCIACCIERAEGKPIDLGEPEDYVRTHPHDESIG